MSKEILQNIAVIRERINKVRKKTAEIPNEVKLLLATKKFLRNVPQLKIISSLQLRTNQSLTCRWLSCFSGRKINISSIFNGSLKSIPYCSISLLMRQSTCMPSCLPNTRLSPKKCALEKSE